MNRPFFYLAIVLSFAILAFTKFSEPEFAQGHITRFISDEFRNFTLKGKIVDDPSTGYRFYSPFSTFVLRPELIKFSGTWYPVFGDMKVTYHGRKRLRYGDRIVIEAKVKEAAGFSGSTFDYKSYLESKGIYALARVSRKDAVVVLESEPALVKKMAYAAKEVLERKIKLFFHNPESHFVSAVLIGERSGIPHEWRDIFAKTQTMHLLAISGLHVGIIIYIFIFIVTLINLPRKARYITTIILAVFYAFVAGARPSVIRATVMGVVFLGSYLAGRRSDILNSLGLAATLILAYRMDELYQPGFIFSFASVISIVYVTPAVMQSFPVRKAYNSGPGTKFLYYFLGIASASCAVWIGLLPLNINFFNIVSPVSLLVNIVAIPVLFVILALSIAAISIGFILPVLGYMLAEASELFIDLLLVFLKFFRDLPFSYIETGKVHVAYIVLYYLCIGLICRKYAIKSKKH